MKIPGIDGEVYFHVLAPSRRLGYGDGRWVRKGRWIHARKVFGSKVNFPEMCSPGMHACSTVSSLNKMAPYGSRTNFCLVQLRGSVFGDFSGKWVAKERKVLFLRKDREGVRWSIYGCKSITAMALANWIMNPHLTLYQAKKVKGWLVP